MKTGRKVRYTKSIECTRVSIKETSQRLKDKNCVKADLSRGYRINGAFLANELYRNHVGIGDSSFWELEVLKDRTSSHSIFYLVLEALAVRLDFMRQVYP